MTLPLALLVYQDILPGSQLVCQLEELGYRTRVMSDAGGLVEEAEREKPMVVVADLLPRRAEVCAAIRRLKANPPTAHVPVIAFADPGQRTLLEEAQAAGAALAVTDVTITMHLSQFLEQALGL
jgi:CheY-like chemotaxis protein